MRISVRELRGLGVDDSDDDGQRGAGQPIEVLVIRATVTRNGLDRLDGADGGTAHAVRNAAVGFVSCWGPMTSAVGIPREAAKTAS